MHVTTKSIHRAKRIERLISHNLAPGFTSRKKQGKPSTLVAIRTNQVIATMSGFSCGGINQVLVNIISTALTIIIAPKIPKNLFVDILPPFWPKMSENKMFSFVVDIMSTACILTLKARFSAELVAEVFAD